MIPSGWLDTVLDVLLSPGLWLSVMLVLIYSLLFSAWRWGGWRQLGRDVLAGLLGFAIGQLIGTLRSSIGCVSARCSFFWAPSARCWRWQ